MPTTRKQKKARKSRGLETLSNIENLDIMLDERHSEREESVRSNSTRRPESANSNRFENDGEIIEKWDSVMIPIPDKILRMLTQMLRSTNCQVS